jgi:conjugative transposon TraN protein
MKKIFNLCLLLLVALSCFAQDSLRSVTLPPDLTIHFISPEPIQYVDISSKQITGDLALPNVLRLRLKDTSAKFNRAVVTITGENFVAQYLLVPGRSASAITVNIEPNDTRPLDISGIKYTTNQLKAISLDIISHHPDKKVEKVKAFDMEGRLNRVYTNGGFIFLDVSFKNNSLLTYDIDAFRFKIDDKKITKASNVQSQEIKPVFVLDDHPAIEKTYRNVFVFKKMSFPGNKMLTIELSEKQLSGRVLTLKISYSDILNADNLPN